MLLPAVGAAALCHDRNVRRVHCGRATRLAIDDIVVYMRCDHIVHRLISCARWLLNVAGSLGWVDKGWAA